MSINYASVEFLQQRWIGTDRKMTRRRLVVMKTAKIASGRRVVSLAGSILMLKPARPVAGATSILITTHIYVYSSHCIHARSFEFAVNRITPVLARRFWSRVTLLRVWHECFQYLRQGGYTIPVVCLFICLWTTSHKTTLHKISSQMHVWQGSQIVEVIRTWIRM